MRLPDAARSPEEAGLALARVIRQAWLDKGLNPAIGRVRLCNLDGAIGLAVDVDDGFVFCPVDQEAIIRDLRRQILTRLHLGVSNAVN